MPRERELGMYEPRIDKSKLVRVYIGDLNNNGDPDELRRMFSRYGSVQDVWVAHKPPGFAFVFYKTVREAREAVKGADGRMVCGVRVRVRMGTEVGQSETHQRRSFEREYDSPPRERSRASSSYQARGYQRGQPRGSRHAERGSRNFEEHSPPRGSPSAHSGWSGRPSHRSMPRSHPSSVGHSYSSKSSHGEDLYSPPSSSHGKYGGHKRNYDASSHYTPMSDRFISRESGSRVTSKHPYHTSPERLTRFSPPADIMYHGNKRGGNRFDHEVEYNRYKDKPHRSRPKEHGYPKISPKISSHHHRQHRSRSPHSFTPPPVRQHDRRHGNKSGWGHGNHSPPAPPTSRRPHYDDNHDHRGYKERISRSDEQFEAHGFSNDRGNRRDYMFDGGRYDSSSRYGKSNDHSYKSADREVKYRGHQRYPSTERYAEEAEYNEPYIKQERVEYVEHNRSDRGSSLEGVGLDDDFPEVVRVERDPNDLRRKLLSEGDSEVREAASSERGYKRTRSDDKTGSRITSPIRV